MTTYRLLLLRGTLSVLVAAAAAPPLHAQCQGTLGTLTLPDPSFGAISEVDLDVDGDGVNDLKLRRTDPSGFGDAQLIEAVALGTTRIANLTQPNRAINVTANNGAVTLYNEELMFGVMDDFVSQDPFLEIEVGGRDGFVEFRNLNAPIGADATIDVVERGVAAAGANNPTTAQCPSLQAPVPVTLRSFGAEDVGGGVRLSWVTATERDCAGFAVERAGGDGAAFAQIGFVAGAGDSQRDIAYAFVDQGAGAGASYYRLRQVDFDGAVAYSPVVTAGPAPVGEVALAGANVAAAGRPLRIRVGTSVRRVRVVDALGRHVAEVATAGRTRLAVPTAALSAGRYYLVAEGADAAPVGFVVVD